MKIHVLSQLLKELLSNIVNNFKILKESSRTEKNIILRYGIQKDGNNNPVYETEKRH